MPSNNPPPTIPTSQQAYCVTEFGQPLQKLNIPVPNPQNTEILIRVTHAGVCHSDLHFQEGFYRLGATQKFYLKDRGATLPRAVGHEILGRVVAYGPDVSEADKAEQGGGSPLGSSRAVYPWCGCGACRRCEDGDDNLCLKQRTRGVFVDGGFAQYITVPHAKYLVPHDGVDPAVACTYGCSGLTVLSAIEKLGPLKPRDPVLLIGAGGLGLQAIGVLKALGHEHIVSADITDAKLQAASKEGASGVVNSSGGVEEAVKRATEVAGEPYYGVIDFVNTTPTAELAYACLNKGGRMVSVGILGGELQVKLSLLIFGSKTIEGNIVGNPRHMRDVMKLAVDGKLKPLPVTEVPWEEANEAMDRLSRGEVTGRLVLVHESDGR
ncbi:NAD-dependent alcohol dehydrogenase [Cyphellophora attinorum]|uniref:NAD-dependent alcohol dehydrogenase n=1 Tax=Cyphellophora attinorum TaxID=1664694 RepID=A0A0N0NJJ8_9EURO|nr:NAD-dependent alcohol dehydrogenase [Phialophora attinorum]KPI37051.1 NAD-dependent alcohol dehydrogenase [Phialophora attinorum]